MKKTFNDLNVGDKIFIVNEGEPFGIRIETPTITEKKYECDDLVLEFDDGLHGWIDVSLQNSDRCGFYFANLQDAQEYYMQRVDNVYSKMMEKAAKAIKKYGELVVSMNNVSKERDNIKMEMIKNGCNLES